MIKSFRGKETERVWSREYSKRLPRDIQERARKGEYSIRINKQWRICFKWRDGHAFDAEIVDYH